MDAYSLETKQIETLDAIVVQNPPNPRFVVGIPHCGLYLPTDFPREFVLYDSIINDSDLGSEELFDLVGVGGVVVKSRVHRNAVDLNRLGLNRNFQQKNKKTAQEKYRGKKLDYDEKKRMFEEHYVPFYRGIKQALVSLRERYRNTVLISGHTFNLGQGKPNICIGGGKDKKLCSLDFKYTLAKHLEESLTRSGLYKGGIGINYPFNGEDGISKQFGTPEKGFHSLLVEFNRELFIDDHQDPSTAYSPRSSNPKRINNLRKCLEGAINVSLREVFEI